MARRSCSATTACSKSASSFFFSSRRRHTRSLCDWSSDVCSSDLLDEDRFEHVGRVLARVDRLLERLVDVLPADDRDRVVGGTEELRHRFAVQVVALVLEAAELHQLPARVLEAVEARDRLLELGRGPQDHASLRLRRRPDLPDAVADDVPRRLVDVVADVVERAGQPVHVVAVERRHEGAVQEVHDLVREPVALVLEVLDVADPLLRPVRGLGEEVDEGTRDRNRIRRRLVEELEELLALWNEVDPRHRRPPWSVAARLLTGLRRSTVRGWCYLGFGSRWKAQFSRRSVVQASLPSRTARSSSARRSSTTTASRGSTSRGRSCSRRTRTGAWSRRSRPTSTCPSRTCTSRSR